MSTLFVAVTALVIIAAALPFAFSLLGMRRT